VIGGIALTLATHGTDQFLVQRLLAARSAREASRGLVLSGFIVFAQFIVFLLIGIMLFVYYQQVPLPQALTRNDEILPIFVVNSLTHGLAGFIVAAIVAAALSPSLNAMAATTVNDFYLRYIRPNADQVTQMRVSRQATVAWGIVQLGVAVGAQLMDRSVLDAGLAVLSFASGAVLGAFLLGTLIPRVRERDALVGMIAGLATMTVVWAWTTVAFTWYVFIGAATTCVVAWLLSILSPGRATLSTAR
jgi:Na+/proline symporter